MKRISLILTALAAVMFTACSGPRYASSTEYDDVYYSSSDQTEVASTQTATADDNYYQEDLSLIHI